MLRHTAGCGLRAASGTGPSRRPSCQHNLPGHVPCQQQQDGWKAMPSRQQQEMQQRCHHTSALAQSPSSPPMSRLCLQRCGATARQEKLPIAEHDDDVFYLFFQQKRKNIWTWSPSLLAALHGWLLLLETFSCDSPSWNCGGSLTPHCCLTLMSGGSSPLTGRKRGKLPWVDAEARSGGRGGEGGVGGEDQVLAFAALYTYP